MANLVNLLGVNIEVVMSKDVAKPDDTAPVDFGIFLKPLAISLYVDLLETLSHGDEHHGDGVELVEIDFIGRKIFRGPNARKASLDPMQRRQRRVQPPRR